MIFNIFNKKHNFIFFILFFSTFCSSQAIRKQSNECASLVQGYFIGIQYSLEYILEFHPDLNNRVSRINLLIELNYGKAKKKSKEYLDELDYDLDAELNSLKLQIRNNLLLNTKFQVEEYLLNLEKHLASNIASPILECILKFQYEDEPHKEFSNGFTYTFNTKGHLKSKNTELLLNIPKSWTSQEGKQPNVIQIFNSDCGYGYSTISLLVMELPFSTDEFGYMSFEEIDQLYEEEIFSNEFAKNFIDGKFISFEKMRIARRSGFLVIHEKVDEKMGIKIKMRNYSFVFHDLTNLHVITCSIASPNKDYNIEDNTKSIRNLFFMIVNSVVVPEKKPNVINLKGSINQKIIDVKIADEYYDFILDTGATTSLIDKSIINKLLAIGKLSENNFLGKDFIQTADGTKHLAEFWNIPSIDINGVKISNVHFIVMEGKGIKPLLGMNILNSLNIYKMDLDNNKIYLKN